MADELDSDGGFSNIKNQVYATLIANFVIFSHGGAVGWFSPALPVLLSEQTPLITGPMTNEELSTFGATSSIGALVGAFFYGYLSSKMGCKFSMTCMALPSIIHWLLIYFGNTFYLLLLARFFLGFSIGGMQSGVILYVSEIANDNIRGRLAGAITPLSRNVGVLIGTVICALVDYEYRPQMLIVFPILFFIAVHFLPNTPQYFFKRENYQAAEKSLKFYKGCSDTTNDREKSLLKAEFDRLKLVMEEQKMDKKMQAKDFCNAKAMRGIITSIAMAWFIQMPGSFFFINFASLIFQQSGTALQPHFSPIILAIAQITGGLVSTQLGDMFGRKTIIFMSLGCSTIGLFTLSEYTYLRHIGYDVSNFIWLPEVGFFFIIFCACAGIVPLANVCAIENFPTKIRTAGVVFYSLCINTSAFLVDKFSPILLVAIRLHGCLLFLAINCCFGILFVISMTETKGKSLDSLAPSEKHENKPNKV